MDDQRSKRPRKDNSSYQLPLENRYAALSEADTNDDSSTMDFDEEAESDNQTRFTMKGRRKIKKTPPPIIIPDRSTKRIRAILQNLEVNNFSLKFTSNNINIYPDSDEAYKIIREGLKSKNIKYYTFTLKSERTHAYVLRGLDHEPKIEEIAEELNNKYNINPKGVYYMKKTVRPLYLIVTDSTITLKKLTDTVKTVQNIRIK